MTDYYPIQALEKGFISIIRKPYPETLSRDITYIKDQGVTAVLSLLTDREIGQLDLVKEGDICRSMQIEFIHYPIIDREVPVDFKQTLAFIETLYKKISQGLHVAMHCRASIGRSGMMSAAFLIYHGISVEKALSKVSYARCVQVPDTEAQKEWLYKFARRLI